MLPKRYAHVHNAFTLIEIMVVVAIIGLLVAVLLPTFGTVRRQARKAQAQAQFQAIDTGVNMFRTESKLGGAYPPSASDNRNDRQLIANPKSLRPAGANNDGAEEVRVAGAHLLVHAMMGADGLGTPGFRDLNRNGKWGDDTSDDKDGAYELDPATGDEMHTRYGGAGYVDDKMKSSAKTLRQMDEEGVVLNLSEGPNDIAIDELMFVDPWDTPILYYRASAASRRIVADVSKTGAGRAGIYWQEDNGLITGTGTGKYTALGLDFGPGLVDGHYHAIYRNEVPPPGGDMATTLKNIIEEAGQYKDSFVHFIMDVSVKARPTPYRPRDYLLISAGPDARYGTDDDITNWTRQTQ